MLVKRDIRDQVWNRLEIKRRKHELDAATVKAALDSLSETCAGDLEARGAEATLEQWSKRGGTPEWYEPFTMAAVSRDPLYG